MPQLRNEEMSLVAVPGDFRHTSKPGTGHHNGEGRKPGAAVFRPLRNGLPEVPYAWRERSYPWAQRALAAAEAEHGKPDGRPVLTVVQLMERRAAQARRQAEWRERRKQAAEAS